MPWCPCYGLLRLTTQGPKGWIKIDPISGWWRSAIMLCALDQPFLPVAAPPRVRRSLTVEEKPCVQSPMADVPNQLTLWLQQVRDHRDRAAFGHLFSHFAPRLKTMFQRSGFSGAQAEEIAQEVLLTVWRKADQFDASRAEAGAWIYGVARNRMIDVARKDRRPVPEELRLAPEQRSEDPSQILALEQEVVALRQAVADLPEQQRLLVEHAYLGELSHSEIGVLTGLPLGTVKSRIRLGLDRLRHSLRELRERS